MIKSWSKLLPSHGCFKVGCLFFPREVCCKKHNFLSSFHHFFSWCDSFTRNVQQKHCPFLQHLVGAMALPANNLHWGIKTVKQTNGAIMSAALLKLSLSLISMQSKFRDRLKKYKFIFTTRIDVSCFLSDAKILWPCFCVLASAFSKIDLSLTEARGPKKGQQRLYIFETKSCCWSFHRPAANKKAIIAVFGMFSHCALAEGSSKNYVKTSRSRKQCLATLGRKINKWRHKVCLVTPPCLQVNNRGTMMYTEIFNQCNCLTVLRQQITRAQQLRLETKPIYFLPKRTVTSKSGLNCVVHYVKQSKQELIESVA